MHVGDETNVKLVRDGFTEYILFFRIFNVKKQSGVILFPIPKLLNTTHIKLFLSHSTYHFISINQQFISLFLSLLLSPPPLIFPRLLLLRQLFYFCNFFYIFFPATPPPSSPSAATLPPSLETSPSSDEW